MRGCCNFVSWRCALLSARDFRAGLSVSALLLLSACATFEAREPLVDPEPAPDRVPYYLQAELDDPFDTIERAMGRITGERPRLIELPATETPEPDLIGRIVGRFEFSDCSDNGRALQWANWFGDRPDYMNRVLNRAHPWLYDIANELDERDLPGELALLPIVESAFDPFAYSRERASGTWQFLSATALDRGIQINDWYDGRRDVYAATRAALDYLTYLNTLFDGDWDLALAAYNAGQGRVQRAVRSNQARQRPTDWEQLRLPRETRAYIPKLHGLGCLFREPEKFGLELPVWTNEPLITRVELPGPTDVVELSARVDLEITELVALNPGLNRHMTPPDGPHHVFVPIERAEDVSQALPLLNNGQHRMTWQEITVRRGDSLSVLAQRNNTTVAALREANDLNGDHLSIGQVLRLPGADNSVPTDSPWGYRYQEMANLQERLLPSRHFNHRVRPGESLWVIARRYSVSVADIQRWNNMGQRTTIRPGQRLSIRAESSTRSRSPAQTQPSQYTVRNGDSLWLIARRLNVSMADLMRWNDLDENSILRPGQVLTIRRGGRA